ncbi:Hypothetical predicted protein [Olea europaea subsp. europaea]|uniref:Ty3-gypsy retrotransposon protein n=1 Tax=Olea europaea subsp. europaea TaxID=158383 RepID=A0A8S0RU47_OLEEU|nr:Hypothetical predicted protein [Olea europaea subsp. europaea]
MPRSMIVAKPTSSFKRLIDLELHEKRDKGLCYRRDEKFKPDHKCTNRELQVLVVQEENGMEQVEAPEEEEGDELGELIELSIKSVVGLFIPQTMKLQGSILGQSVVVIIDCGATHNFISNELVWKLGLNITSKYSYGAIMGTGLVVNGG